jgi:hypothetical protein
MAVIFTIGDVVRLVGLKSNPLLNGAIGTVVGDSDYKSRGRCAVHLQSPAAAVAAHPSGISLNPLNLMQMLRCVRPDCDQIGTMGCSVCRKDYYCGGKRRKEDWKARKLICNQMKLMLEEQMPFKIVGLVVQEVTNVYYSDSQMAKLGRRTYVRLLEHTVTFAEHQFGKRVVGKAAYERGNGKRLDNWEVEINLINSLHGNLGIKISTPDIGGTVKEINSNAIPIFHKSLALLEPWMRQIKLSEKERTNVLTEKKLIS